MLWGKGDTEIMGVVNQYWSSLRPMLWEGAHLWHCLEGQDLETEQPKDYFALEKF